MGMPDSPSKQKHPAKRFRALRGFGYRPSPKSDEITHEAGDIVANLPANVVKDLQTNHGEPVLAEVNE